MILPLIIYGGPFRKRGCLLLLTPTACQLSHIGIYPLFAQRVKEGQSQSYGSQTKRRDKAGQIKDLGGDGRIKLGCRSVSDQTQQPADHTGGQSLSKLPGEGVDRVDGAVLPNAVSHLRIVNDIGDHGPDHGVKEADADIGQGVEQNVHIGIGRTDDPADQVNYRACQAGDGRKGFAADLLGNPGSQRRADGQNSNTAYQRGHGLCGGTAIVVGEHIGGHALHTQHSQQQQDGGNDNSDQSTVGTNALEHLANVQLFVVSGNFHTLTNQVEAKQVAYDGANAEDTCNDGHTGSGENGIAIDRNIGNQRGTDANHQTGQRAADGSPGGQLSPVIGIGGNGGGHGAIGDIHRGVENGAPQDISNGHPCHLEPIGHVGKGGLINQEGGNGHRAAHPLEPGTELAVLGGLGTVNDLAHGHIGNGVHKTGNHHQGANHRGGDAHDIGVEFQHKGGGQDEGEVIGEVAKHIAYLIPHTERTNSCRSALLCHSSISLTFFNVDQISG